MVIEPEHYDDEFLDDWEDEDWDVDEEDLEPAAPTWRRPTLIAVAVVTALAMAVVPLYNVFFATTIADNGLEVCGFDYCVVQDGVRAAGLDLTMSRLSNTFLEESEARALANELTGYLGVEAVGLVVVEDLEGRLGGVYDRSQRTITIESPARAWTVLHEVAHAVEVGHGDEYQAVVIDLAAYLEAAGG
jgi:hypothetical protein